MTRRAAGGKRAHRIQDVRIIEKGEGLREAKVDQQLSAYKDSQAFTRVVIKDTLFVGITGVATDGAYSFPTIRTSDEFVSLSEQYTTFKVSGMRFDVVDFNPAAPVFNIWGTYHGSGAITGFEEVTDLPDSKTVTSGGGKMSFYWYPSGPLENSWFEIDDVNNFGGLVWTVGAGTPTTNKFSVVVSAIVDFRARR